MPQKHIVRSGCSHNALNLSACTRTPRSRLNATRSSLHPDKRLFTKFANCSSVVNWLGVRVDYRRRFQWAPKGSKPLQMISEASSGFSSIPRHQRRKVSYRVRMFSMAVQRPLRKSSIRNSESPMCISMPDEFVESRRVFAQISAN